MRQGLQRKSRRICIGKSEELERKARSPRSGEAPKFSFSKIPNSSLFILLFANFQLFCYDCCMEIVLASGNMHKRKEFEAIFEGYTLLLPSEIGIEFYHEETGRTFLENALGKAQTLRGLMRRAGIKARLVISDDSGICLPALGGEPGIYSARYGHKELGRGLTDEERNAFLLDRMRGKRDREAFFVCAMVLLADEYRFFTAQETLCGLLARKPSGAGGFGYDPLLYLPERGCTVAELEQDEKNRISHRAKAAWALLNMTKKLR
jgi:XTP/dITP diphosphohydrolase